MSNATPRTDQFQTEQMIPNDGARVTMKKNQTELVFTVESF